MQFARLALGSNDDRGQSQASGGVDARGVGPVGDDDRDASVRDASSGEVAGDGLEVRAASGEQDAEMMEGSDRQASDVPYHTARAESSGGSEM
jgi:hypothetical protein